MKKRGKTGYKLGIIILLILTLVVIGLFVLIVMLKIDEKKKVDNLIDEPGLFDEPKNLFKEKNPESLNNESGNETDELIDEGINELSLRDCLESEGFSVECDDLFLTEDILDKCADIEGLEDNCYYTAALVNLEKDYCGKINDEVLKENCNLDLDFLIKEI